MRCMILVPILSFVAAAAQWRFTTERLRYEAPLDFSFSKHACCDHEAEPVVVVVVLVEWASPHGNTHSRRELGRQIFSNRIQ